ncbi:MAG: hypothetical protein N3D15_05750 [Syntrophorhabdaceae bacterium]|nr:hypothetical protein [Syntrophorhabdaceae bacterium]
MTYKVSSRSIIISIALLLILLIHGTGNAFKNEPDGFRSIIWGTEIEKVKNMRYLYSKGTDNESRFYKIDSDIRLFGGAEIDSIEYEFYKGRFVSVILKVKDLGNFSILKSFLFKKHGIGKEPVKGLEAFYWAGDKTIMSLILKQEIS